MNQVVAGQWSTDLLHLAALAEGAEMKHVGAPLAGHNQNRLA